MKTTKQRLYLHGRPDTKAHFVLDVSSDNVKEIRLMLNEGFSCTYISKLFSVHRKTISDIKLGRTWK